MFADPLSGVPNSMDAKLWPMVAPRAKGFGPAVNAWPNANVPLGRCANW